MNWIYNFYKFKIKICFYKQLKSSIFFIFSLKIIYRILLFKKNAQKVFFKTSSRKLNPRELDLFKNWF